MSGYAVNTAVGRIQAGEVDSIWVPRADLSNRRGVILCHGAGSSGEYLDQTNSYHSCLIAASLASAGYPCIAGDFGGAFTWGNDTVEARITAAWSALRAAVPGVAADKIALFGVSMGTCSAIRWAQANPSSVACLAAILPLVDPNDVYVNNRGSYQSSIGTAWGVTYPTALPTRGQLSLPANMALYTGPQHLWYSSVDTIVIPSTVTTYATATGATTTVCDTTNGHADASVGEVPIADILSFFGAHT